MTTSNIRKLKRRNNYKKRLTPKSHLKGENLKLKYYEEKLLNAYGFIAFESKS